MDLMHWDFEGGELYLPQLSIKIPWVPRQLIAFIAGSLALLHNTIPWKEFYKVQ